MNVLLRRATLLAMLGLLATCGLATAGLPDPAYCSFPAYIDLVGCDVTGASDPLGRFTVTVKDNGNFPVGNSWVEICFNGDVRPFAAIDSASVACPCVGTMTDLTGKATFAIPGAGFNTNGTLGYTGQSAAAITVDGSPLGTAHVTTYDENGVASSKGVGITDLSAWLADYNQRATPPTRYRSDFNHDGNVGIVDLSYWVRLYVAGKSALSCGVFCDPPPPTLPEYSFSMAQINFQNCLYSLVGEFTVDRDLVGGTSGYVNVVDPNTESPDPFRWLIHNLPVFPRSLQPDYPKITTLFGLGTLGAVSGTPFNSTTLIVDYNVMPSENLQDILARGRPAVTRALGHVTRAIGGDGLALVDTCLAPPPPLDQSFSSGQPALADFVYQSGHPNVQAGHNQCVPAGLANGFEYLRLTTPLTFNQPFGPGFGPDGTLVGTFDVLCERPLGNDRRSMASLGTCAMDGTLLFIGHNGLANSVTVKHQGSGLAGESGGTFNGDDPYFDPDSMGVTSHPAGRVVSIDWIIQELRNGGHVSLGFRYDGPRGGGHCVEAVGAGRILGMPFLLHVSDYAQANEDANDTRGCDMVNFELITDGTDREPRASAHQSNAFIYRVNTVSYKAPTGQGFRQVEAAARGSLAFALQGVRPNPSKGRLELGFSLPDDSPATLELLDVAGRRVFRREVGALGAGHHVLSVGGLDAPRPGVYLVRLVQRGRALTAKVVMVP